MRLLLFLRRVLRPLTVAVLCPTVMGLAVIGLVSAPPAGAARRAAQPTAADLQRRADQAGARYEKAVAELSRLGDAVDWLAFQIASAETRLAPFRVAVTRRAVAVYTGDRGLDAIAGFADGSDIVESARGARLASGASARDYAAIRSLGQATTALAARRDELATRRQDQQRLAADLKEERGSVEQALAFMTRREQALQSRLVTRASRGERAPLEPLVRAGTTPTVTDFACPVRGAMTFTDTWGAPRSGGRRHEGTDIMNAYGTPNVAVVSGSFETHHSGLGGLSIYLHGDDGHTYYYAHLSQIVGPDRQAAQGEVIARTGSSGDATTPHTHFEFHPNGGRAVNSYPLVRARC